MHKCKPVIAQQKAGSFVWKSKSKYCRIYKSCVNIQPHNIIRINMPGVWYRFERVIYDVKWNLFQELHPFYLEDFMSG